MLMEAYYHKRYLCLVEEKKEACLSWKYTWSKQEPQREKYVKRYQEVLHKSG